MRVGFVGLGTMGGAAARTMAEAGHEVFGFDKDEHKRHSAQDNGVKTVAGIDGLSGCGIMLLSLPGPLEVTEVVKGTGGATEILSKGTILVDLSTVDPDTSRAMAEAVSRAGLEYLDSPVLGTPQAVGNWILPIGGNKESYEKCVDLLSSIAARTFYLGDSGKGSALKLLNNLMVGVMANGIAEVLAFSHQVGLSPQILLDVIGSSKAPTNNQMFQSRAKKIINGDFEPTFKLDLLAKDVDLGIKMAAYLGIPLMIGRTVDTVQKLAQRSGLGEQDFSILYEYYRALYSRS
jgi:3-hydroxyisobutyrate dehydrogenase-like beta-hydroxyacid dehydrogenase